MESITEAEPVKHASALPILAHRQAILDMVNSQFVSVIQGDTGCGKSSQVPQFLLQDARARHVKPLILCTQPRRIAAISLAKRVADEMGEPIGRSIGYMIGADRVVGRDTEVRFVTTGWAFEKLIHNDSFLEEVTHFVVDEVHERSIDADLLHLLIKLALPKIPAERRPRVVLMSATFNAGVFSSYYCPQDPPEPIFVGVKRYEVQTFHLDELSNYPPLARMQVGKIGDRDTDRLGIGARNNMLFLQMCRVLHDYHVKRDEPCCILVFLSGLAEIDALWELIEEMEERDGGMVEVKDEELSFEEEVDHVDNVPKPTHVRKAMTRFQLCMLHSSVDKEDQMTVFTDLPFGKTRIILSTNIAESSVTIPNARYVFDAGFHKHMAFDPRLGCTSLKTVPASKAAAKQRAGRTGRLFPGVAIRFYSSGFYEAMPDYDEPDMLRLPLFNTVLRLKVAAQDDAGFVSPLARPSEALQQAIDAPSHRSIQGAYDELFRHGHMVAGPTDDLDDSIVTPLGKFLQKLNVDIRLGSLVVTALVLFPDYLPHAIVLAVSMSLQNIFVHANARTGVTSYDNQINFFSLITKVERERLKFNGAMFSDALTTLRAFGAQPNGEKPGWLHQHGIHGPRMHQLQSQVREMAGRLAPLAPAHVTKQLQHLQARNYRFTFSDDDKRILHFMMLFSLSDQLMAGSVSLKSSIFSNPTNVGFAKNRTPYADWQKCIFFEKIPQDMLDVGGSFERLLLNPLLRQPHGLKATVHVGKTQSSRDGYMSWVAVEFDSVENAMFAQVVLEACAKNGKLTVWLNHAEKIIISAPVARSKIKFEILNDAGVSARLGGTSAISYILEEGDHFFIPGQTVYVGGGAFVEDLTWLNGKESYVHKSLALIPSSQVVDVETVSMGKVDLDLEYEEELLRRLVYLKHLAHAATSTQFDVRGRMDLGAEICRTVLDIDPSKVAAPPLKAVKIAAQKAQPTKAHPAKVIMISTVDDTDCHAKISVRPEIKLRSILGVASAKVLKIPADRIQVRVQKTGRALPDDQAFGEAMAKEADAFNILRLEVLPKGMLAIGPDGHAADEEEAEAAESDKTALGPSKLSVAGKLREDVESDDWLCATLINVLKLHADGRMLVQDVVSTLKLSSKQPERVNLSRVIDVVRTRPNLLDLSRNFVSLGNDVDLDDRSEFSFDGTIDVDDIPKNSWNSVAATLPAPSTPTDDPTNAVQYSGLVSIKSNSGKKKAAGKKKSPSKRGPKAGGGGGPNNNNNVDGLGKKFTELKLN